MTGAGFKVAGNTDQPGVFTQILGPATRIVRKPTGSSCRIRTPARAGGSVHQSSFARVVAGFYRLRTGDTVTKLEPPPSAPRPSARLFRPERPQYFPSRRSDRSCSISGISTATHRRATNSALVIPNARAGNVGNYYVVVANPAGTISSAVVTASENIAPTITTHPQNQTVSAGGTAIFSVAATGTSPLQYQWHA